MRFTILCCTEVTFLFQKRNTIFVQKRGEENARKHPPHNLSPRAAGFPSAPLRHRSNLGRAVYLAAVALTLVEDAGCLKALLHAVDFSTARTRATLADTLVQGVVLAGETRARSGARRIGFRLSVNSGHLRFRLGLNDLLFGCRSRLIALRVLPAVIEAPRKKGCDDQAKQDRDSHRYPLSIFCFDVLPPETLH